MLPRITSRVLGSHVPTLGVHTDYGAGKVGLLAHTLIDTQCVAREVTPSLPTRLRPL